MYWLGMVFAMIGGCLFGVFGVWVYLTYCSDKDYYYEGCRYEADDWRK